MTVSGNVAGLSEAAVAGFFGGDAQNWQAIYSRPDDVFAVIHQLRRQIAREWITDLDLPTGSAVLEVGCGAGLTTIDMARLGLRVRAVDNTIAMVELARANAGAAGLGERVATGIASAHALPDADGSFDLAVALGVLPWLADPERGLGELARVLRPGGWLLANIDNRNRLNVLLDPRYTPLLEPVRAWVRERRAPAAAAGTVPDTFKHTPAHYRRLLRDHGLIAVRSAGYGFGPFTLMGRHVLPGRAGVLMHRLLQRLAGWLAPLDATGAQYLVLARKR